MPISTTVRREQLATRGARRSHDVKRREDLLGRVGRRVTSIRRNEGGILSRMAVARVAVRLYARADRDEIRGVRDGVLLARVAASPVDGKANRALCRLLARELGVRPSDVSVVLGVTSRDKLVQIEGISEHMVRAAIDRARGRSAG